ncbi:hypothetical protein QGN29_04975 [Temperatibacter marinus]|uniref:LPS export ABC transporter periplasmic protein LptC n=1 Tax=Temperatibacter marinus TaxID=1456591 RepID=A0AA52HBK0_9PROT|nr:LPS export ABC transporter periplasmic protein LptC [Temperatibacter marinus]WND03728.1 hypothetical protein QGN29_04975 [Temperatibacter marinus]
MVDHPDHNEAPLREKEVARAALLPISRGSVVSNWDKFVYLMRRFLPVSAFIAALVTIGWPLLNENEVSFTLSTDDVLRGDDTVHMKSLRYRGTDAIDRLFTITAGSGLQKDPNAPTVRLTDIMASIQLKEAGLALVTARTGVYHRPDAILQLAGGVNLETGNGYSLEVAGAEIRLKERLTLGQGTVKGATPLGTLSADRFKVDVDQSAAVFEGRVSLKIIPKKSSNQ